MGDHLSGAVLALLVMAMIVSLSFPYTLYNGALYCNTTCADCVSALNNDSYSTVYLNSTLSSLGATCIDNPANFSNKTFDCQGYSITGNKTSSTYGIYLNSRTNVTIRNCTIEAFQYNLRLYHTLNSTVTNITSFNASVDCAYLYNFTNSTLSNSTLYNCTHEGMSLDRSINSTIANNTIYDTRQQCIELAGSSHYNVVEHNLLYECVTGVDLHWIYGENRYNLLRNNTIYETGYGIAVWQGSRNIIVNNTIQWQDAHTGHYCYELIWLGAMPVVDYCDNIIEDNVGPGGLPIYFSNETVNWDGVAAAQIILCDADNSVVTNSVVNASGTRDNYPFEATFTFILCDNLTVSSSVADLGHFELFQCSNATLSGNVASDSTSSGFEDYASNGSYFGNNTSYDNNYTGFYISSNNATLIGNTAYGNHYSGISVYRFRDYLARSYNVNSTGANLTSNTVYGNKLGGVMVVDSQNATLSETNAYSNGYDFVDDYFPPGFLYAKDHYFGIYLGSTYNVTLSSNTIHSNNYYGIAINNSNDVTSTNDNVYENGLAEIITSALSPSNISFNSLTLHPYGYPTISFPDELEADTAYTIKQVSPPTTAYPDSLSVVESRMINITTITGTPTITSMIWSWGAQQEGSYDESIFDLWRHITFWTELNATVNTTGNTINYSSISMGAYGILGTPLDEDEGKDIGETEPECNIDSDCGECYYCSVANGKCAILSTAECTGTGDCAAGYNCTGCKCVQSGCLYDSDCLSWEYCAAPNCLTLECECGYIDNHNCIPYECCADSDCPAGHSCKGNSCVQTPAQEPGSEEGGEGEDGGTGEGTAGNLTGVQEEPQMNATEPSQSQHEAEVPSALEGEGGVGGDIGASSEPLDVAGVGGIVLVLLIIAGIVYFFYMRKE